MIVVLGELEGGALELFGNGCEAIEQGAAAGNDQRGMAAQHLRGPRRQMKLALADIHPHVGVAHHQIGIARQAETGHIEKRCQMLIGHRDIDMLEMDGIAEVLGGAVEMLLLHGAGSRDVAGRIIKKGGANPTLRCRKK